MRNKNTQSNAHLWPNVRNSRVLKEIGVEEHDGDVRFQTESRSTAVSRMRNEKPQYNADVWPNRRNSRVLNRMGVEKDDGDVRFYAGSGNTDVPRMRNEKNTQNIMLIYEQIAVISAS